jgi:hypothetical protein
MISLAPPFSPTEPINTTEPAIFGRFVAPFPKKSLIHRVGKHKLRPLVQSVYLPKFSKKFSERARVECMEIDGDFLLEEN